MTDPDGVRGVLPRDFCQRDTVEVARDLLGRTLVREQNGLLRVARIVETEAYGGPEDLASHAARSATGRARLMFGPVGHVYVYLIYGMHHCLNVVAAAPGEAGAVLIRALEPLANVELATNGPGRVCRALAVDRSLNGHPLDQPPLWLAAGAVVPDPRVHAGPRVGVEYAGAWAARPWRFCVAGNPHVSRAPTARSQRSRTDHRQ